MFTQILLLMDMPVKSKVDEINLRPYEYLLPVFEMIVNSIISVNDRHKTQQGLITINIERENTIDSTKSIGLFEPAEFLGTDGKTAPTSIKKYR